MLPSFRPRNHHNHLRPQATPREEGVQPRGLRKVCLPSSAAGGVAWWWRRGGGRGAGKVIVRAQLTARSARPATVRRLQHNDGPVLVLLGVRLPVPVFDL